MHIWYTHINIHHCCMILGETSNVVKVVENNIGGAFSCHLPPQQPRVPGPVMQVQITDFYELRISVGNEYRAILFTIDHENIVQAEQILLLNGFMKKSTKDYKKEIQKAQHILDTYYEKED